MNGMDYQQWRRVNRQMIARMLAELEYEQVLQAQQQSEEWRVLLGEFHYRFTATRGIWGWLHINASSLSCEQGTLDADQALCQLARVLKLSDGQTAEHLQDLYATLRADMQLLAAREGMSAEDLIALDADRLQCLLAGHPKFIFNKARRGWGLNDLQQYAPEYQRSFRLHWLAVRKDAFIWSTDSETSTEALLNSALDAAERQRFARCWQQRNLDDSWLPLPLHPWQWQQKIAVHFLPQLASGELVELGEFGDRYLAQQSLRTLTNISRPVRFDIKLPLTIYNTSCYRGIPGKYISAGPAASRWLQQIFARDPTLRASGATILAEPAAGYLAHDTYAGLSRAPYRYQEMLGIIWRESPGCYLQPGEQAILMAALMETDNQGKALIAAWIARSGLSAQQWLEQLFRCVVIPLYHLMCCYGVSLIAHGQNIQLVLKEARPQRILLKDFQGDMRLVNLDFPQAASLPTQVKQVTTRLSADYLIHDLQTGHFVTVLRFISPLMAQCGISETLFYQLLVQELRRYMAQHPQLAQRFALFDLFKAQILRVVLNPVKLSWSEQDEGARMLPDYRQDLDNPLSLVTMESGK